MSEILLERPDFDLEEILATGELREELLADIIADVVVNYSEAHRRYHTPNHLNEMIDFLADRIEMMQNPRVVFWATLYHDYVYDIGVPPAQNERISAECAMIIVGPDLSADEAKKVFDYIDATATHENTTGDPDLGLFLDADMAILGASAERYKEYAAQIRQEFIAAPYELYRTKRVEFLEAWKRNLKDGVLYFTPSVHAQLADQTLANLEWEIETLSTIDDDPFVDQAA